MARMGTMALGLVAAAMLAGVIAPRAADGGTPGFSTTVEVTVWRDLDDGGDLYVGARAAGGLWRRAPTALDLPVASASGRFERSGAVKLTVPLAGGGEAAVDAVVWRSTADPARLWLSVRPEGGRWRTVNAPLAMRAYEHFERTDAVVVTVPLPRHLSGVSIAGPLAVFTAGSGEVWTDAEGWGRARDVYVLDTATDTYWRALTWRGGVATAGERLIVWDDRQVRRTGLDGRDAEVLYEGADIREVEVSPDGAKMAVMAGDGALIVLDTATGGTLLRVAGYAEPDTPLAELLIEPSRRSFHLGKWNAAGTQIAVAAVYRDPHSSSISELRTSLFALDGDMRVLPLNAANVSPDHRYAIIPREPRPSRSTYASVWRGFSVRGLGTSWSSTGVGAGQGFSIVPYPEPRIDARDQWRWPVWWAGPNQFTYFVVADDWPGEIDGIPCSGLLGAGTVSATSIYISPDAAWCAAAAVAAWEAGDDAAGPGPRILDAASGEIRELDRDEWKRLKARNAASRLLQQGSALVHGGRVIWSGDVHAIGLIELDGPLALRGVNLHDAPRLPVRAAAPARGEMVGPLFAWSEAGGYETEVDSAGARLFHELQRIVVHDVGTGHSWRVHEYRGRAEIWPMSGGFIVHTGGAIRYVTPAGRVRTLIAVDDRNARLRVFPGHAKVIVSIRADHSADVTLALFALPSGQELLRVESTEPRFKDVLEVPLPEGLALADAFIPLGWNADGTAFSVAHIYSLGPYGMLSEPIGTFSLDGGFTAFPPDTLDSGTNNTPPGSGDDALSPDFRYAAVGRNQSAQSRRRWDVIDIVEVASGRVARTVPVRELSSDAVGRNGWGWTASGRFAWSTANAFNFRLDRLGEGGDDGEVWLLDVETGATERLSVREYVARRSRPAGTAVNYPDSSVNCPDDADPIQRCAVLLDGEVVGEGRWAEPIGFVALD